MEILTKQVTIRGRVEVAVQIRNKSEVPLQLQAAGEVEDLVRPVKRTLYPDAVTILELNGTRRDLSDQRDVRLSYVVENLRPHPDHGLPVEIPLHVRFESNR